MRLYYTLFLLLSIGLSSNAQMDWNLSTGPTSCFSSARMVDLNLDGVKDIVLGGGIESYFNQAQDIVQTPTNHMVMAMDGATGEFLWTVPGMDQIFGSPVFKDINGDLKPEVFIGGRNGYFMCINGADGAVNWMFFDGAGSEDASLSDIYNFFTPQWIPDQNGDGMQELLNAHGGDRKLNALVVDRPVGELVIVDPFNGELIASAKMPDNKETYMSPIVCDFFNDGELDVIFGTGGETIGGKLYRIPLADVRRGDLSSAVVLASNGDKGFIAPPSLADLNGDNIPDIIAISFGGKLFAIDGWTNEVIWSHSFEGFEVSSSPAIGLFNEDDVPDVMVNLLNGINGFFNGTRQVMFDGASGIMDYDNTISSTHFSTPLACDFDQDGRDEAVMSVNVAVGEAYYHDIVSLNFVDNSQSSLIGGQASGTNLASTPLIGNFNNDGKMDLFYVHNTNGGNFINTDGVTMEKHSLTLVDSVHVAWGSYMGSQNNGFYENRKGNCFSSQYYFNTAAALPPNCIDGNDGQALVNTSGCPCVTSGCLYEWTETLDSTKHAFDLTPDTYYTKVIHPNGCIMVRRIRVPNSEGAPMNVAQPDCFGDGGSIGIQAAITDSTAYTNFTWSDNSQNNSINNLAGGTYNVQYMHPSGCIEDREIEILEPAEIVITETIVPDANLDGNGSIQLFIEGGVPPYSIDWNGVNQSDSSSAENLSIGDYSISLLDANNCSEEYTFRIAEFATGLNTMLAKQYEIYPNPSQGLFNIKTSKDLSRAQISLIDVSGKLLLKNVSFEMLDAQTTTIRLDQVPANGTYYLEIITDSERVYKKLAIF